MKDMRRRFLCSFIGALGLAKAQTTRSSTIISTINPNPLKGTILQDGRCLEADGAGGYTVCKPPNGECPNCRTQAPPYKPDISHCGDYSSGQPEAAIGLHGCEPRMTIVRCAQCNIAFWQDAE